MNCRHCEQKLSLLFVDLGTAPASNAYLDAADLASPEKYYPLKVWVCSSCFLVQTEDYNAADELFTKDYAYFSGLSQTWLKHCECYIQDQCQRFALTPNSTFVEVASNDGSLLQYAQQKGLKAYGIEPTQSTADVAKAKGLTVFQDFFTPKLARELCQRGIQADLMAANNVLAHVPQINDFVQSFAILLKDTGVATFEFPHLLNLIKFSQFDTIYHEHYSYLSLSAVVRILATQDLEVFDVEELSTHGGSLRVYAQKKQYGVQPHSPAVAKLLQAEADFGLLNPQTYLQFQKQAEKIKWDVWDFLVQAQKSGQKVAAYGAAAKGNTLLNYCGIQSDAIDFVVDLNPAKQGKFLPGSRIPIVDVKALREHKPDLILIFPWNIQDEIMEQIAFVKSWNAQFVSFIPERRLV